MPKVLLSSSNPHPTKPFLREMHGVFLLGPRLAGPLGGDVEGLSSPVQVGPLCAPRSNLLQLWGACSGHGGVGAGWLVKTMAADGHFCVSPTGTVAWNPPPHNLALDVQTA